MLNDLQIFKCKNCGAELNIGVVENGVIECEYCFSKFTVHKKDVSPTALSFLRQGEHDLDTCKFDEAYTAYAKAAEYDKEEPEAYWGMALAGFRVQYLKDHVKNCLQPICHEISEERFADNNNYKNALKYATEKQRAEYIRKAEEIDAIREEFYRLQGTGLDYDCFICVKVTEESGEETRDCY